MHSGKFSWTMSFWMRGNMALSSNARMASIVDSIQGFFPTQQITRKSKNAFYVITFVLIAGNIRILIASIRNLGKRPCPRLIPLSHVHNMGMARDMMQRETMARVDDIHRRSSVNAARRVIYEKNFQVNSAGVENMLQDMSLVPTAASYINSLIYENNIDLNITECIL
jgi:hypothetical protein